MSDHPLVLAGQYGSPYSLKMRAVLRYRHIPFRWVPAGSKWDDTPPGPVPIIPRIVYPDADGNHGEATVDSSPQIMRLERDFTGRSVVPVDPALAFIDALIEDFGDEWLTKAMYHYRWTYDADIALAGNLLPIGRDLQMNSDQWQQARDFVTQRQIGRRALVGSTELNLGIIEDSYVRVLDILQQQLASRDFLLGDRPGRGDFGLFGQFTQLVKWDPTPVGIASTRAPKVVMWTNWMDDLSWLPVDGDSGWVDIDQLPDATTALLGEIGRTYAPFMVANAQALADGADEVECEIDGTTYRQAPFGYQGKCLAWLREDYAGLEADDRRRVDDVLAGTGCEILFAG